MDEKVVVVVVEQDIEREEQALKSECKLDEAMFHDEIHGGWYTKSNACNQRQTHRYTSNE